MVRLILVLVAMFLLWHLWQQVGINRDRLAAKRLRKLGLYLVAIALLAFGLWMAASGRLHLAWVGLLGLLTFLRKGMFLYQFWRRIASLQQGAFKGAFNGGFNSFFQSAKRTAEQAARKRKTTDMSHRRAAQILGVAENASKEQITRAFRAKMRSAHPDVGGSEKIARELNAARDAMLRS